MENSSNEEIKCVYCKADIPEGNTFCTECGKPIKQESKPESSKNIICPKCSSEIEPELKFCTECGTKIQQVFSSSNPVTTCPKCYAELSAGTKFCTECGENIGVISAYLTSCPKCHTDNETGLRFCTECGTLLEVKKSGDTGDISEKLRKRREAEGKTNPPQDEILDNVVDRGKNIMKELGGFLNKTASEIDRNINQAQKKGQGRQSKEISERLKKQRNRTNSKPGYLVCDSCGGYYELQKGEAPDDFSEECDCGGQFKHQLEI